MLKIKLSTKKNDKAMRLKKFLGSNNKGLTVGELTMAVGAIIIISLIWNIFQKNDKSSEQYIREKSLLKIEKIIKA